MIAGLILVAAGLNAIIGAQVHAGAATGHATTEAHGNESMLLYGLAVYLLFDTAFRGLLRQKPLFVRLAGALLALGLAILAPLHGLTLLAVALLLMIGVLLLEGSLAQRMT